MVESHGKRLQIQVILFFSKYILYANMNRIEMLSNIEYNVIVPTLRIKNAKTSLIWWI